MEQDLDRLQSIVARSNLVATVGEFIPKSQLELQENGCDQCETFTPGNTDFSNACSQGDESVLRDANIAGGSGVASCSLNLPHSSRQQNRKDSNCTNKYPAGSDYNKSNAFFADNKEGFSRHFQNKPNSKWKRSEFSVDRNRGYSKFNSAESGQTFENVLMQHNKYFNKSRQKPKCNENSNLSAVRSYERNGTVYFRNDGQNSNYPEWENTSWRQRDRLYETEQYHMNYSRNRYRHSNCATGRNSFAEIEDGKGRSHKNGSKFRSKDYSYTKNENKSSKVVSSKSKNPDEENHEVIRKTSQREHLIDLLTRGVLECLVCCEFIYQSSSVWSCNNCYHVLHLKCIMKWANSSKSDFGWRCPACQNVTVQVPFEYYCFCGKTRDPEWNHHDCPHSCGEICGKTHRKWCPHKCTLLCHPGPCPQCTASVVKHCGCQKTSKTIQCCSSEVVVCDGVCGKELNCLIHGCTRKCHSGGCGDCKEVVAQDCHCGKQHREVKCTIEAIGVTHFCCGNFCEKKLDCGNHTCTLVCHEGNCPECQITPALVKFCSCGKTELSFLNVEERKSCVDPIPTCDLICEKKLSCGQPENSHTCQSKCHNGPCPVCPLETIMKCRCGHVDKTIPCATLNVGTLDVRCDKRCSKKRSCGKHKCNQLCCTGVDHECPLPCSRLLQCGRHRCEETCHKGHCKPCLHASFEELSCECGAEVIFPPVPCGTRRPNCDRPCTRTHACDHPPTHNCHSANQCPPCTVLTKKYCHGRHEVRKAVPCHQESFSCGLPCGKEIECGRHKCILSCHPGPCLKEHQSCVQPCSVPKTLCGHICGAPCHEGPCPSDTPCKEMVRVTCECGHRYTTRACHDNAKEYQRIATAKLATKMADLQAGQTIDLNDVVGTSKKLSYKTLECNEECKLIEKNRRLAIALQIRNPDLSAKLTPRYSEYLKNWAKRDPKFCQMIHDKLTDLVQLAKQSKQKSRSFSFDPMNREKRHFVHEYCEHFGCESVAYDQEPKRNVVATALKDKSWLPSMSITEFLQKENSPRKVPGPVITKSVVSNSQRTMEVLPSKILANHQPDRPEGAPGISNESQIDYFDWRPQNS